MPLPIEAYLDLPKRVILSRFPDQAGNEDLIQDCYCAMLSAAKNFRGQSQPETYLWRVCVNAILDRLAQSPRQKPRPLPDAKGVRDDGAAHRLESVHLLQDMESLSPQQKAVLTSIQRNNYNVSAAAESLGMSRKKLLRIARQAAKQIGLIPETKG